MKRIIPILINLIILLTLQCYSTNFDDPSIKLYDALHYDINLKIDIRNKILFGQVNFKFKPYKPLQIAVLSAANATISVDSVYHNRKRLNFKHFENHLYIDLEKSYSDTVTLQIHYRATSDFNGEFDNGGVYFNLIGTTPKVATSSQPFFTRKWIPLKDIPNDKVTADLKITVPDTLLAVSNGKLIDTFNNHDGTKTYFWSTKYPIASYLIFFAVGNYEIIQDTYTSISNISFPINYYVFPEYIDNAKEDFNNTKKMLKFMEYYFGEYPFAKEKYGIVLVPGELMMENQTITSIKEDLITGKGDVEQFLIHELAHQWFGNFITPKSWHHLWLNEGFANYIQALYYEYYLGKEWYHHIINYFMNSELGSYAGPLIPTNDTSFNDLFSEKIYFKSAIVLHMLRKILGDSTFFKTLKTYVTNPKFKYANVTTEDFIETCKLVSGKDLNWFFEQWVYANPDSIDRPVLKINWSKTEFQAGYKLNITIKQLTSDSYNFIIPTELNVITKKDTLNFDITITAPEENFNFFCDYEPLNVIIDKDNWVFKKTVE